MPWWDSNPQSQQASSRRPTPYIAQPLGPADLDIHLFILHHYALIPLDNVHNSLVDTCHILSLISSGWLHASTLLRSMKPTHRTKLRDSEHTVNYLLQL